MNGIMNTGHGRSVLLFLVVILLSVRSEKKMKLINNGYEGVVVAIHPDVPEEESLVEAIKKMMADASIAMFQATRNRAYFKQITILVPKTWTNGSYSFATSETFKYADIRVAPPNGVLGDNPYAWRHGTCGTHGEYIHLTPAFITQDSVSNGYGPRGKVVVHEWGHYRWGVQDEYPTGNTPEKRHENSFYPSSNGWEATRCSLDIRGKVIDAFDQDCVPNQYFPAFGCKFVIYSSQPSELSSSLMYAQYIDEVTMFCHDDPSDEQNMHNKEPRNNQNKACNDRSAWDVIMTSEDFQGGSINTPDPSISDIIPSFSVVKHQSRRIVLVLDTSGSMEGEKIMSQRSAADLCITSSIGDGSFVGLVQFDSDATVLEYLTELNHGDDSREELVRALPVVANGRTGIGNGILKAIEVLEASGQGTAGGQIIVLTDGEENVRPYVDEVAVEVLEKGIVIDAIFFGLIGAGEAQPLAILSLNSSGNWYYATDASQSRSQLQNIFATLSKPTDGDLSSSAVQISIRVFEVESASTIRSTVSIDSSVGNRTELIFSWTTVEPEIVITPPSSNCVYSNLAIEGENNCSVISHVTDLASSTTKFTIQGTAEFGTWKYAITSALQDSTTVTVTSAPSTTGVYPITVNPELQITNVSGNQAALVIAVVSQNGIPVLGADVSAAISRPLGEDVMVQLYDNGAGADVTTNDGVYSRYFTNFTSQGRYSIQVTVLKNESEPAGIANIPRALGNPGTLADDGTFSPNPDYVEQPDQVSGVEIEGNLERIVSSPGIAFTGSITTNDSYPPNKITDLSIDQVDLENADAGVLLTFTAPGDDFDSGTATRYDVRVTNESASTLLSEFDEQPTINTSNENDLFKPKSALENEEIQVFLPPIWLEKASVRISIAIRSYDEVGNPSEVSNVASTRFFIEPPPFASPDEGYTWIIVGAAAGGGLALVILVGLLIWCLACKRKK